MKLMHTKLGVTKQVSREEAEAILVHLKVNVGTPYHTPETAVDEMLETVGVQHWLNGKGEKIESVA